MQASSIPAKFPVPFAAQAGAGFIRTIPLSAPAVPGGATLTLGFPPSTFNPEDAGGNPPFGADFNGLANQITAGLQWIEAGGPTGYDAVFSGEIGGYPKGSVLAAAELGRFWLSLVDNNVTDPDTGGAGWVWFTPLNMYAADTGAANAYACAFAPPLGEHVPGLPIRLKIANQNNGPSTLNPGPGPKNITLANGSALSGGELVTGMIASFNYDGQKYQIQNPANGGSGGGGSGPTGVFGGVGGSHRNLLIQNLGSAPNTILQITCSEIVLDNATLNAAPIRVTNISTTVNSALTGAGGIDVGSVLANKGYNLWLGYNPSSNTTLAWATLDTNVPTPPPGYIYYQRIGWQVTDGSTNWYRIKQVNRSARYIRTPATNTAELPTFYTGLSAAGGINVSLSGIVSPTAIEATGFYAQADGDAIVCLVVAPSANYLGRGYIPSGVALSQVFPVGFSHATPSPLQPAANYSATTAGQWRFLLEFLGIWVLGIGYVFFYGWEDNI